MPSFLNKNKTRTPKVAIGKDFLSGMGRMATHLVTVFESASM